MREDLAIQGVDSLTQDFSAAACQSYGHSPPIAVVSAYLDVSAALEPLKRARDAGGVHLESIGKFTNTRHSLIPEEQLHEHFETGKRETQRLDAGVDRHSQETFDTHNLECCRSTLRSRMPTARAPNINHDVREIVVDIMAKGAWPPFKLRSDQQTHQKLPNFLRVMSSQGSEYFVYEHSLLSIRQLT